MMWCDEAAEAAKAKETGEDDDYDNDVPELNHNVFTGRMWNNDVRLWLMSECKQITVACIVALISWYVS